MGVHVSNNGGRGSEQKRRRKKGQKRETRRRRGRAGDEDWDEAKSNVKTDDIETLMQKN